MGAFERLRPKSWTRLLFGVEPPAARNRTHSQRVAAIVASRHEQTRGAVAKASVTDTAATADPMEEQGKTGLRQNAGHVDEEFLPQLSGKRALETYREMRSNDSTIGAVLFAIEMLMRQVPWRVEPAGETPADVAKAEFLSSCVSDMAETWPDLIAEILTFLPYGHSLHEPVYKRRLGNTGDPKTESKHSDGRIGWQKIPGRAQETLERWEFDTDTGELLGVWQQAPPDNRDVFIPVSRFLLFRSTTAKGNPEGRSVLRTVYRAWWYKKRIEEIEGIGVERDLAGLPVLGVPPEVLSNEASPDMLAIRADAETIVRNIRRDEQEGLLVPLEYDEKGNKRYELTLLSTGGRRQFDTTGIIDRYDKRIAMAVLADFILLGQQAVGSYALADSKTSLFAIALGAWLESIEQIFERQAIPQLFALNTFPETEELPRLVHSDIETPDLAALAEYVSKLATSGLITGVDDTLEQHLRTVAGLPEMPEKAKREGDPPPDPAGGPGPDPKPEPEPTAKASGVDEGAAVTGSQVLNGAQITAILEIVGRVAGNELSKASGIVLLRVGFGIEEGTADAIIGDPTTLKTPNDGTGGGPAGGAAG